MGRSFKQWLSEQDQGTVARPCGDENNTLLTLTGFGLTI